MSQIEREIADLFHQLVENFNKTAIIDGNVVKLLRKKVEEFGNEKLIEEFSKVRFENYERGDESDEESLMNKKAEEIADDMKKKEKNRRKTVFKIAIKTMGTAFATFIPGIECVYKREVTNGGDESDFCVLDEKDV